MKSRSKHAIWITRVKFEDSAHHIFNNRTRRMFMLKKKSFGFSINIIPPYFLYAISREDCGKYIFLGFAFSPLSWKAPSVQKQPSHVISL